MALTNRGKFWEFRKSLWVMWAFTVFLGGVGMVKAGRNVKRKKWQVFGYLYLISTTSSAFAAELIYPYAYLAYFVMTVIGLVCIFHTFGIRKEYLVRLEVLEDLKTQERDLLDLKNKVAAEFGFPNYDNQNNVDKLSHKIDTNETRSSLSEAQKDEANIKISDSSHNETSLINLNDASKTVNNNYPVSNIDINLCNEMEFATLPGVGTILAKKAIRIRNTNNGFDSLEQFFREVGVKEHHAKNLRDLLICTTPAKHENKQMIGRRVDF